MCSTEPPANQHFGVQNKGKTAGECGVRGGSGGAGIFLRGVFFSFCVIRCLLYTVQKAHVRWFVGAAVQTWLGFEAFYPFLPTPYASTFIHVYVCGRESAPHVRGECT